MRFYGVVKLAVSALALVMLAGCVPSDAKAEEPLDFTSGDGYLAASRITEYRSLEQLAADSDAIVEVRVDAGHSVRRDDLGFWRVPLVVTEVYGGDLEVGEPITVRTEVSLPGTDWREPALAAQDRTFLLYLTPLQFLDGPEEGVWSVTGYLAGYFERTRDGAIHHLDPESAGIHSPVTEEDVRGSV